MLKWGSPMSEQKRQGGEKKQRMIWGLLPSSYLLRLQMKAEGFEAPFLLDLEDG